MAAEYKVLILGLCNIHCRVLPPDVTILLIFTQDLAVLVSAKNIVAKAPLQMTQCRN